MATVDFITKIQASNTSVHTFSDYVTLDTTNKQVLLENVANTETIIQFNHLTVTNIGASSATVDIEEYNETSNTTHIVEQELSVPVSSSVLVYQRTDGEHLLSGWKLQGIASANDAVQMSCSYVVIDDLDMSARRYVRPKYFFQGWQYGYASGGYTGSYSNVIQKFPFASDSNSTDVANLSEERELSSGKSSSTHGYNVGGILSPGGFGDEVTTIDKFSFASDNNATDIGDISDARRDLSGQSSSTHGYASGGVDESTIYLNTIDKFSFSTDGNSTDIANLTVARSGCSGISYYTYGYVAGGNTGSDSDVIDKFAFASDGNATDVGNLTVGKNGLGEGVSSTTHGYVLGGHTTGAVDTIEKFAFASDGNATDISNLTIARYSTAGQSSTTHGYSSGGNTGSLQNVIDKFQLSTDSDATDVGDILTAARNVVGHQY
jgi:hypothetical protein